MSLQFGSGERLAIVGENGAGKSSLMNVLYGLYQPDQGTISIDGKTVRFRSPKDAIAMGIGMVHQHFMLVPNLTVAENVVLGREPTRGGLLDMARACEEVAATCRRFGFQLEPRARVETLTVGSQQKVEIVKALHRGARTLILDEPTAVLTPQESDELLQVAHELSAAGHTVVLISHKLREVLAFATRIVVMRRGQKVAEVKPSDMSPEQLAALMMPPVSGAVPPPTSSPDPPVDRGRGEILELVDVHARGPNGLAVLKGVSLAVRAGEIVGIAGVDGNGQRELAEVVTGLRPIDRGTLKLNAKVCARLDPAEARRLGVAHVPEDRLLRGIVGPMTVEENVALGRHDRPPFVRCGGLLDFVGRRKRAERLIREWDVRPKDATVPIQRLSGGNQQKVVVGRELDGAPKLLVVVQPTRGLDIASVRLVHERLRRERDRGAAVLLISLDLEEVLTMSDRLYVLFEGRITRALERSEFDERKIGRSMLGAEGAAA